MGLALQRRDDHITTEGPSITAKSRPITAEGLVLQRRAVPITEQGADMTAKGRPYYNGWPKYYSEEPPYYSERPRITATGRA